MIKDIISPWKAVQFDVLMEMNELFVAFSIDIDNNILWNFYFANYEAKWEGRVIAYAISCRIS